MFEICIQNLPRQVWPWVKTGKSRQGLSKLADLLEHTGRSRARAELAGQSSHPEKLCPILLVYQKMTMTLLYPHDQLAFHALKRGKCGAACMLDVYVLDDSLDSQLGDYQDS